MRPSVVLSQFSLIVLAFAVSVPTTALVVSFPDSALSRVRDEVRPTSGELEHEGGRPEEYIVSTTYTVSSNGKQRSERKDREHGKRRSGKDRKHSKRQLSTQERFEARRDGVRVTLEPQLGISDYGFFEDVRGRVYSFTGAGARNVQRMRIGGALLTMPRCNNLYDDETPTGTEQVFSKAHYGYSPWTNYERGTNDCWMQTGHNYFKITLPNGRLWDSDINGDTVRDM